jgi:hypothetical protein
MDILVTCYFDILLAMLGRQVFDGITGDHRSLAGGYLVVVGGPSELGCWVLGGGMSRTVKTWLLGS